MKRIAFSLCVFIGSQFLQLTIAHSWLSCPQSFDPNPERGYYDEGPCETVRSGKRPITPLRAGERLKVGWPSNNHGGGYVRLALVPESQIDNENAYKSHVLKFTCYGHDERPDKFQYGDCHHPCNARPGCEYQSSRNDSERYDTTITIPTNLKDGRYVLQWVALSASETRVYYSCSLLSITGGNPKLKCNRSGIASVAKCMPNDGDPLETISHGTKAGNFCYEKDGLGDIDDRIWERPVNADCDPRTGCVVTSDLDYCKSTIQGIRNPRNPRQPSCKVVDLPNKTNRTSDGSRLRKWIRPGPKLRLPKPPRLMPKGGNRRQRFNSEIRYHRPNSWVVEKPVQQRPTEPYLSDKSIEYLQLGYSVKKQPKIHSFVLQKPRKDHLDTSVRTYLRENRRAPLSTQKPKYISQRVVYPNPLLGEKESNRIDRFWHQQRGGSTDYTHRSKSNLIGSDCEENLEEDEEEEEEEEEDLELTDGESEEYDSDNYASDYSDEENECE